MLIFAGHDHQIEIEVEIASERAFVDRNAADRAEAPAVRSRSRNERPHLEELIAGLRLERPPRAGDVLDEPQVEARAAVWNFVECGVDRSGGEIEEELPVGRLTGPRPAIRQRRKFFGGESRVKPEAHVVVLRELGVEKNIEDGLLED